ncbi:MAG: Asp23/Gls24 family envelope stress response protein [Lachnospiraceae bacterium]|nr:Asp23/Gls24 family envelope stress response protein [Lachnospiraceae bacterium]
MKLRRNNDMGEILVNTDVIAQYAGSVACECFGVVGMAGVSMRDGLVKLLRRERLSHGVRVEVTEDKKLRLDFHVIVVYGVSIRAVADNLIESVKYQVEQFSGVEVEQIHIHVEGVRVID